MRPRYAIGVKAHVAGALDAHGNPIDSWLPAVAVEVYSIGPRTQIEPETGRTLVVEGLTVYAPPGTAIGPLDRVVIDGVEFEVEGDPADWTRGSFGWAAGIALNLKRAEG